MNNMTLDLGEGQEMEGQKLVSLFKNNAVLDIKIRLNKSAL